MRVASSLLFVHDSAVWLGALPLGTPRAPGLHLQERGARVFLFGEAAGGPFELTIMVYSCCSFLSYCGALLYVYDFASRFYSWLMLLLYYGVLLYVNDFASRFYSWLVLSLYGDMFLIVFC